MKSIQKITLVIPTALKHYIQKRCVLKNISMTRWIIRAMVKEIISENK